MEEAEEADEAREPFRSTAFRPGKTNKKHNFFLPNHTRRKHGEFFYPFFISNNCHTRISARLHIFFSNSAERDFTFTLLRRPFPQFSGKKYIVATMGGKREEGKERGVSSRSPHQPAVENGGLGWEVHGWTFLCVRPIKSSLPDKKKKYIYRYFPATHFTKSPSFFVGNISNSQFHFSRTEHVKKTFLGVLVQEVPRKVGKIRFTAVNKIHVGNCRRRRQREIANLLSNNSCSQYRKFYEQPAFFDRN